MLPYLRRGPESNNWRSLLQDFQGTLEDAWRLIYQTERDQHGSDELKKRDNEKVHTTANRAINFLKVTRPGLPKEVYYRELMRLLKVLWPKPVVEMLITKYPGEITSRAPVDDELFEEIQRHARGLETAIKSLPVFHADTAAESQNHPTNQPGSLAYIGDQEYYRSGLSRVNSHHRKIK